MQLKSPTDKPVHIALLSGHSIVVGPEGREVPQFFLKDAMANGCIPVSVNVADLEADAPVVTEKDQFELLKDGIKKLLAENAAGSFTDSGLPNRKALSKVVGWNVSAEELIPAWRAVDDEGKGE